MGVRQLKLFFLLCALLVVCEERSTAHSVQEKGVLHPGQPTQSDVAGQKGDIVVVGTPQGPFPVTVDADNNIDLRLAGREAAEDAHFFSRCVKPFDNGSLHELIDGQPNRVVRAAALNRIIHGYMACYKGFDGTSRDYGTCNARNTSDPHLTLCQSFYYRGALVEKVLETYDPELTFSTQQLFDPPVISRFLLREDQFNKTRSKTEIIYAQVAGCIVATHPDLALAYIKSELASKAEDNIRNALLGSAEVCLKGAKRVEVDPTQFRIFIADAIYSWAVALEKKRSLIPYKAKSSFIP